MKSKFSGRYLVIDIGASETKILDASVVGNKITIYNAVDMRDMTPFLSSPSMMGNIRAYTESLASTVKSYGIKTRRCLVCSSIFGITTNHEDMSSKDYKDSKVLDKYYQDKYGRASSNLTISDYKLYGSTPGETELKYRIMVQRCGLGFLKDFIQNMREVGFEVLHIESTLSAVNNLSCLFDHSYDLPCIGIVDYGATSYLTIHKSGAYGLSNKGINKLGVLPDTLARELGIPAVKAKKYLYKYGLDRNSSIESEMYADGVDAERYYSILTSTVTTSAQGLVDVLKGQTSRLNLGNYQAVVVGGCMDIKGVYELFESAFTSAPITCLRIESVLNTKTIQVQNKMNGFVGAKYAVALGVLLGNQYAKGINLVPQESMTINSNSIALVAAHTLTGIGILAAIALTVTLGFNGYKVYQYRNVEGYLSDVQSQISSARAKETKYKSYLAAIQDLDNVAQPLVEFVSQYTDSNLRIASIDTPDMLAAPEVEEVPTDENGNPIDVTYGEDGLMYDEYGNLLESTESTDTTGEASSSQDKSSKQDIVIRGYATDSSSITEFFNRLQAQSWVPDLSMVGVKQIELNQDETMYIFEIQIRRFPSEL